METDGCTYIIANKRDTVLYVGVTSDLCVRMHENKNGEHPSTFSATYKLHKLVYYDFFPTIEDAISHEKYVKGKKRQWKIDLINAQNPNWEDLTDEICK